MGLIRRITPLGRVLIGLTIAVAVAVAVLHDAVTYIAAAAVCLCWLKVYAATDPVHRAAAGDDPAGDSVSWRDREL
ncbi:MAG TPA: hypothetical protein VGL69_21565 [Solirubrobacteraceae bacterium]|jgi:hypothetical protein